ncbi:hypothetical protein DFH09DRAFT_1447572 [Mycena vulgaris]|nr:hypothetical protein DFH09DRAFT_1447572 [Mycena vulgaris]
MYLFLFLSLLLQAASLCRAEDSFHHKIHGVNVAHAQESQRIFDLVALASDSVSNSTVASSIAPSIPLVSNSVSSTSASAASSLVASSADASATPFASVDRSLGAWLATTLLSSLGVYDGPSLAAMCSPSCTSSLNAYRANVVAACGNYQLPGPNNPSELMAPRTTNEFCNEVLTSFGPTPAQGILGYPSTELCTPCMLGTMNATPSNPLTFYPDFYAVLQSALKICGSAEYHLNRDIHMRGHRDTILRWLVRYIGQQPIDTGYQLYGWNWAWDGLVSSSGMHYIYPTANQTCEDIVAAANGKASPKPSSSGLRLCISPHGGFPDVDAVDNGAPKPVPTPTAIVVGADEIHRPPPGQTPPGTTSNCGAWYFVQPGSTAERGLHEPWANYWYCVAPFPPLDSGGPTTTIPAGTAVFSMISVSLPSASSEASFSFPTGSLEAPGNLASGSIATGCDWYYNVVAGDTCASLEALVEVSDSDFTLWNVNPTNPCPNLVAGTAVCILVTNATAALPPTPTNAAAGSAPSGCACWYTIVGGDGCAKLETTFNLTQAQLFALNPELASACTNLALDETYCVRAIPGAAPPSGPPPDLNPGSWSKFSISFSDFLHWNPEVSTTCNNLNIASYCVGTSGGCESIYTAASGDSCGAIETKTSLSDVQLRALNPWIDTACDIQIGQNLCVKNSNVAVPPAGPPANLNPGSWSNCTTYYNVQSGDNCNLIEAKFKIGFSDILRWNPEISTTCSNLNLASYCVLGSGACSKIYTVVSGDSCGAVETKETITDAQLHAENTWINAACSISYVL